MALLNGTTPEQQAKEIVNAATEEKLIAVAGTTFQKLETVVRYLNRDKIMGKGNAWFTKNFDYLVSEAMDTLITAREKAITDYLKKKEQSDKDKSFREFVARGMAVPDAYKQVYK